MLDIILRGGSVLDGTGREPVPADVGIGEGRIARVEPRISGPAVETTDVAGMVVAPGFIDIHSHTDMTLAVNPRAESKVRQEVTTEVVGNCGLTAAPVSPRNLEALLDYLANTVSIGDQEREGWRWPTMAGFIRDVTRRGVAVNIAPLVGQGTIRVAVMGLREGEPTPAELCEMVSLLQREMDAGLFGMSSGLQYPPNSFSTAGELLALCRVVARSGGVYSVHLRNEGAGLLASIDEVLSLARKSGVSLQVSHIKASGRPNWGKTREALRAIEAARDEGCAVTCDQYPYTAFGSSLLDLLPEEVVRLGAGEVRRLLAAPESRARLVAKITHRSGSRESPLEGMSWDDIRIAAVSAEENSDALGKTLAEIARVRRISPARAVCDLLATERGTVKIIGFSMNEAEVQEVMRHPLVMVASDGRAVAPYGPLARTYPHPRYYGTFPRVLGRYARELNLFGLAEAVRKITSLPARKIGLVDRGAIRPGAAADLVVFDPASVNDRATFEEPHQYPAGIRHVLVNGRIVVRDGEHLGVLPGKVLTRPPRRTRGRRL